MKKETANRLAKELRESKVKTPVMTSMLHARSSGIHYKISELTKELMYTLAVKECCSDIIIGAIFETNHNTIKQIRNSMGIEDSLLAFMRAEYRLAFLGKQIIEKEGKEDN